MPEAAVSIEQERRTPEILSFRGTAKSPCRNMKIGKCAAWFTTNAHAQSYFASALEN